MADFFITCDTYTRLAGIVEGYEPPRDRQSLRSVYIERRGGHAFAISSCSTLLVGEYIGHSEQEDGSVNLSLDPALIAQCRTEVAFKSGLFVNVNPMLKFATAKTSLGYVHPQNAAIWDFGHNWAANWRKALPKEEVKKSKGFMHWYAAKVAALASSSPSGRVVFPERIDATASTIIRDAVNPNWFGLFMPRMDERDIPKFDMTGIEPGELPKWAEE